MANKFENISNYNESIANESNNIGQKLFAYISKGKNINDRIRDKFKKSLIFIGDEGQIYNPLTNTYVGIGQTAYTATISYIEDAQEKISTLSKMLASSMVSSIYANWSKDEWMSDTYNPVLEGSIQNSMPTKIYATNEIVLKGLGDYDPTTKLAASREYSHITDDNAKNDDNLTNLYAHTYKNKSSIITEFVGYKYSNNSLDNITLNDGTNTLTVNGNSSETSSINFDITSYSDNITKEEIYEDKNKVSAFATSGITVSLNKGLNKYLYSYTFTFKPTGINVPSAAQCIPYVGMGESTEYFRKVVNIYATDEQLNKYKAALTPQPILDENGEEFISSGAFGIITDSPYESQKDLWNAFWDGIEPVYEDDFDPDDTTDESEKKKRQLFKQSANTLTIDDKLTWSYISSAYSYTVNFSKEYTDNQVNMIYRELLGEEAALIPASEEQVKVLVPNSAAELNTDRLVWNESTKTWTNIETDEETGNTNADSVKESSTNLGKYVLDYSSTFVSRHSLGEELDADLINPISVGKVLPWQVLDDLAQAIASAKQDASKVLLINEENSEEQIAEILFSAAAKAITNFKPKFFNKTASEYQYVSDVAATTFTPQETSGKTLKEILGSSENGFAILNDVYFMGYDRTLQSAHTKLSDDGTLTAEKLWNYTNNTTSNITLHKSDEADLTVIAKGSVTSTVDYDEVTGITKREDYTGIKYNQPYIYKIIDQDTVEYWITAATDNDSETLPLDTKATPLFVVNTSHVGMDAINLADGIQTLKEVAYVLDIITDGWGNQYDPEGNGILLTYTIASNHERIEDHEQRLQALEGGKNVVRAIFKETDAMSKYVNLHITSDTSWIASSTINTDHLKYDVSDGSFDLSYTWYGVIKNEEDSTYTIFSLPKSYLYSYVLQVKEYNNHIKKHDLAEEKYPKFSSLYGFTGFTGFIEFSYKDNSESWFKDNEGNPVSGKATYTGQVGLGIDLNVATSYSTYIYCNHTSDGYEVVDLNSNYIIKTGILNITLPKEITYNEKVVRFTEPISNEGNYSTPYVNTTLRFTQDDIDTLNNNQLVSDATGESGLLRYYKSEIEEFLNSFDGINESNTKIRATLETREYTGLNLSLNFVINTDDCVNNTNKPEYRTQLYDSNRKIVNIKEYSTTNNSSEEIKVGETPNQITIAAGETKVLNNDYSSYEGLSVTPIGQETEISWPSNEVFYIRKSEQEVLYYDTNEDALTNVKWVSSYVSHTVENVKQSLKEIEFEAYQYSKNLISQLDGNFVSSYGMYVAGISQKDGKVTPIVRELPKDSITASTKVWGETTDNTKQYVEVSSDEIENDEIAMDTPLFIKSVDYYEVPLNSNYVADKVTDTSGNFIVKLAIINAEGNKDIDEFVYQFNEGEYEYVSWLDVNDCLSSARIGRSYRNFIQSYFKRDGYVQIDGADLRKVGDEWKLLTGYNHGENEGDPDVPVYETTFYKVSDKPTSEKKYISAEVDYQDDSTDGVGGNNFKVTAHITKLSDASEDNSGLVDAYDVRNTLDNMFEWVDLSRWDEDETETTTNPVNTNSIEKGGNIDAANRINATKVANSGSGLSNELGYPIDLSAPVSSAESTEPATPEGGDTGDDTGGGESESEEGA